MRDVNLGRSLENDYICTLSAAANILKLREKWKSGRPERLLQAADIIHRENMDNNHSETAALVAGKLLEIGAVLLRPSQPFTWASGWHSPIYCDNRRILSYPELRSLVAASLAQRAKELFSDAQVAAGVATGAIAHGALAADRMGMPFVYVRPKPKDHGTGSQIEGILEPGTKVVVIEDLISTGMSSLAAVDALRKAGAEVLGMVAIFTYGFDLAAQRFAEEGVALSTLSDYSSLVKEAARTGYVTPDQLEVLSQWRKNPSEWGK